MEYDEEEEEEDEDEKVPSFVGFKNTVKGCRKIFQDRLRSLQSPYLKTLFSNMKELEKILQTSPDSGEISFSFGDWTGELEAEEYPDFSEEVKEILSNIEKAIQSKDYKELKKAIDGPFGNFNFTGDINKDISDYTKFNEKYISVFLIGFNPKKE